MIVDDEPEVLEKARSYLEENEFDVVTAPNSRKALQFLEENEKGNIDLILIDTPLPGGNEDGFYSMKPESKIPDTETGNFLQKPFTREQLLDFVKDSISSSKKY
jgi:DNA-binding NtrC family response regulator